MNCSAGTPLISMSNRGASILCSVLNPASSSSISIARRWSFAFTVQNVTAACASLVTSRCAASIDSSASVAPASFNSAIASVNAVSFAFKSATRSLNPSPETCTIWLITMRDTGTLSLRSSPRRRPLSLIPSTVGIVTMTNSVVFSSRNKAFTSFNCAFSFSSFCTASSGASSPTPNKPFTASPMPVSFCRKRTILPMLASRKSGSDSKRSVCPVGAVSKTMRVNLAYFSSLMNCTTLAMAIASSSPGGGVSKSSPSFKSPS
mmetsp:Transcript_5195/g.20940  ORF Transcript_5195/g.20940 Transcript_5195/m.20940 type:complete len:262 (-) Transcript_5195:705-1490(-)